MPKLVLGPGNPIAVLLHDLQSASDATVWLASAYASRGGLADVRTSLVEAGVRPGNVTIVVGLDPVCVDLPAVAEVLGVLGANTRVHSDLASGIFHPKFYAVHEGTRYRAYLGSHNLTRRAFRWNVECGAIIDAEDGEAEALALRSFWAEIYAHSVPLTEGHIERWRAAVRTGSAQGCLVGPVGRLSTARQIAEFLMWHPEYTPCLNMLGQTDTGLDLALAFDYLRAIAGVPVPSDLCEEVAERCNLPQDHARWIPADLHRAFQSLGSSERNVIAVIPPPDDWPEIHEDAPRGTVKGSFRWLLSDPKRSPLTHGLRRKERMEWAYTLDYLHTVGGLSVPWNLARTIVRRSQATRASEHIFPPDTLRGEFRKSSLYPAFCQEKGW
jgi:hypothetical protein